MRPLSIAGREIGPGTPCFVIAEAGVNHNGSLEMAQALIDVAAKAGADAVKFQTFHADDLATAAAPKAQYQKETTDADESQLEMLRRLELDADAHRMLMKHCEEKGVLFMSSPFDEGCADLLEGLGVEAFKIPSGELTNLPFLRHVAAKGRPMIVSSGMATLTEVEAAVEAIRAAGDPGLALLHCVSAYPAAPEDANLRAIDTLAKAFEVPAGWSDHTRGTAIPLAAVARGACVIEKHFTLDRTLPGPDHRASLEPAELSALVRDIRDVEVALGNGIKAPTPAEEDTARVARKSLVAARDLAAGTVLASGDLAARRPGTGLPPARLEEMLGRRLSVDLAEGTLLEEGMTE